MSADEAKQALSNLRRMKRYEVANIAGSLGIEKAHLYNLSELRGTVKHKLERVVDGQA